MLPKYSLHHVTYLGTKFEAARSNGVYDWIIIQET